MNVRYMFFRGLQELWDTLGVSSVPSLPPVVRSQHKSSSKPDCQPPVLVPEASMALTLIMDLVNSHVGVFVVVQAFVPFFLICLALW